MATNPNFEVVCNIGGPYCQQYSRNNSEPGYPWSGGSAAFASGPITHVSMILSYPWGNLEAIVVGPGGGLQHWWRDPKDPNGSWNLGAGNINEVLPGGAAVGGPPSLIQVESSGGTQIGNFELLVPSYDGYSGILHLTRDNSAPGFPWSLAEDSVNSGFAANSSNPPQSVALIQSDYGINPPAPGEFIGGPGTLECVVQNTNGDLVHWYLDQATGLWTPSVTITNASGTGEADGASPNPGAGGTFGIGTAPAFIQPSGGYASLTHRNFEVVVGVAGYPYLAHYYRDNSQAGGEKWHFTQQFGVGSFPAMILSTFGSLEVVVSTAVVGESLAHWWRNAAGGNWTQSASFGNGTGFGLPGFIQDAPPPEVLQ